MSIQGGPKKLHTKLMTIILSNLNQVPKFFHSKILLPMCSKVVIKDPTTPCLCCHTTL